MMKQTLFLFLVITLVFACKPKQSLVKSSTAEGTFIVKEALMDCFPKGLEFESGENYNCEFSAVETFGNKQLIFGNDKNINDYSPVVLAQSDDLLSQTSQMPKEVKAKEFFEIRKIEDFAYSLDEKILFICTGFDRIKSKKNQWDSYNTLLAWQVETNEFQILMESKNKGVSSSKKLRKAILEELGHKYMKIEGLMVLPENRLVFGVREVGKSYKNPIFTATLLECQYEVEKGKIKITTPIKMTHKINTSVARPNLGLSSLYYDKEKKKIYITTSYEEGEEGEKELGGFIWSLTLEDYFAKKTAKLIKGTDGKPLALRHKVEGITKMKNGHYFIIYDNDRTDIPVHLSDGRTVSRASHQAVYSIISLP